MHTPAWKNHIRKIRIFGINFPIQLHRHIFLELISRKKKYIAHILLWFRKLHIKIVLELYSSEIAFQLHQKCFGNFFVNILCLSVLYNANCGFRGSSVGETFLCDGNHGSNPKSTENPTSYPRHFSLHYRDPAKWGRPRSDTSNKGGKTQTHFRATQLLPEGSLEEHQTLLPQMQTLARARRQPFDWALALA